MTSYPPGGNENGATGYGTAPPSTLGASDNDTERSEKLSGQSPSISRERQPLVGAKEYRPRAWSFHDSSPLLGQPRLSSYQHGVGHGSVSPPHDARSVVAYSSPLLPECLVPVGVDAEKGVQFEAEKRTNNLESTNQASGKREKEGFFYYTVYALINIIISVPGLYGYAAVIFNHPVFAPHMNVLSKLVIFSSCIHQLGMSIFSSLPFAIGTVQDAGLIFLSAMSNIIANNILEDGGTAEEVLSTTLVILPLGTAALGIVLIIMGHFRLADAVAYLPMPVVGGYLAYIGYFCLLAGTALCISQTMMDPKDWLLLLDLNNLMLAVPGLVAGLVMTWVSRNAKNEMALPLVMIAIPALFYVYIFATGIGLDGAREGKWVGEVSPPVPVTDMFSLINFSCVKWEMVAKCVGTWVGMVFVVSFASCLDVAAISLDMGEALDTNRELSTVGICNFISGCTIGFTGSYIFSQTIFTYRTGCHSKWIGVLIMVMMLAIVISTVNVLQVSPLFFLGSTLIFIGYDLCYEWLIEVRHKLFLSEYIILLATFFAIHLIGIDGGIVLGVIFAIIDFVCSTAKASSLSKVLKRSRAVWKPDDWKLLDSHGYHPQSPKIITFEVKGSVFFGSSLEVLSKIANEIGIDATAERETDVVLASPHRGAYMLNKGNKQPLATKKNPTSSTKFRPEFVVLDLANLNNLDASAARGCFLQLAKLCAKHNVLVCASGANPRVDWMLRSHEVAYDIDDEDRMKQQLLSGGTYIESESDRVLLFLTVYEALEFCESLLIHSLSKQQIMKSPSFVRLEDLLKPSGEGNSTKQPLSQVFSHILGLSEFEREKLRTLDKVQEVKYQDGDIIAQKNSVADSFFVVLSGGVAVIGGEKNTKVPLHIVSGAGPVKLARSSSRSCFEDTAEKFGEVRAILQIGAIFGFVDFLLDRTRSFSAVAAQDGTTVAKLTHSDMMFLKRENTEVHHIVQTVLLQVSAMELANCTCCE